MRPGRLARLGDTRGTRRNGWSSTGRRGRTGFGFSFRAKDKRFDIIIHSDKWFDNRAGVGGAEAIDIQMQLSGGDFRAACRVLPGRFRLAMGGLAFPVKTRGLDPNLIDPLHERGLIYANNHRPDSSLVFLHRTPEGKSKERHSAIPGTDRRFARLSETKHPRGFLSETCRTRIKLSPSNRQSTH